MLKLSLMVQWDQQQQNNFQVTVLLLLSPFDDTISIQWE